MVTVHKEGIIFEKTNRKFESQGVMNPATIHHGEDIHLFYRAVGKGHQSTIVYRLFIDPKVLANRGQRPLMVPESAFEKYGLEDPRIVKIEAQYYCAANERMAVASVNLPGLVNEQLSRW